MSEYVPIKQKPEQTEHQAKNDIARDRRGRSRRAQLRQLQKALEANQHHTRWLSARYSEERERCETLYKELQETRALIPWWKRRS